MASKDVYTSDKELEDLYNSLEKGSLVRLLIEKHRELEREVKKLTIPVVVGQSEQLVCDICFGTGVSKSELNSITTCNKCLGSGKAN